MVEIAPKHLIISQALPSWRWLLWVSIALLMLTISAYFGLRFYLARLQAEVISLNGKIKEAAAAVNAQDEETVIKFNDSLNVIQGLFANHSYFSNFFNALNSATYPKIFYYSAQADANKNIIQLQGKTQSYTALAKQIVALRANPMVQGVEVASITFTTEGLQFSLKVDVKSDIFHQQK